MGDPVQPARRSSTRSGDVLVGLVLAASAIGAAMSDARPTAAVGWDRLLLAGLAAAVVLAAAKAPRSVVIVMAAVGAGLAGFTVWAIVAWLSLALAVASASLPRRNRPLGAIAAGLSVQALLRLPALGFFGLTSLVAGATFILVLVGGYRYATKRTRKNARRVLAGTGAFVLAISLIGGVSLLSARSDIDTGVSAARRGLAAARSGDTSGVVDELVRAETALISANSSMKRPQVRLLRLVPIVAQHQRSIESATSAGALVAREAAATVRDADIGTISLTAGSIDLAALQAMAPQLRSTVAALERATETISTADTPWVVAPLRNRVAELTAEIDELLPEIQLAAVAAEVLPQMLGIDGPDTYFVFFGTPAESREFGGFIGSWALLTFENGRMKLGESGRITELYSVAAASSIAPGTVSNWFLEMARPTQFPQNLTSSPDFAQVAEASRQVLGGSSTTGIDGFIYVDARALTDMLEITGPVEIPLQEELLSVPNAPAFFFEDQYRFDASSRSEIFDVLAVVADTVVERISEQTLPGPEELGRILGPAARGGHLQVITFNEEHNNFLRSVKVLRDFGREETADYIGLVQTNGLSNKMDLYLERTLDYQVELGAEGLLTATATATLRSVVPPDAPEFTLGAGETRGQNRVLLSLYTPHALTDVSINGAEVEFRSTVEFDLARYLVQLDVPPTGEPFVVEFTLSGVLPPNSQYSLKIWEQPLVNTDRVSVSYRGPDGAFTWEDDLHENVVLWAEELAE